MSTADPVALEAVDAARAALVEQVGADVVGDHLAASPEDKGVVTHQFACSASGYPGWVWAVTVAHVEGAPEVTVDEVVMLPGDDAIIAPPWVPWRDRIQSGDLSPGDLLPTDEDDPRLVPTYISGEDFDDSEKVVDRRDRPRQVPGAVARGPRARRPALVRQRPGPRGSTRPVGARPLRRMRLPGAAHRPALDRVRRLRQRVRQRRRPGGLAEPRLWRALGGPAAQEAAAPATPDHVFDTVSVDDYEEF